MANPALKDRKEMSTDLKDAGFDARQSRAIVQAMVDAVKSLGLVTRADLRRVVAALNGKLNTLKKDMVTLKADQDKKIDDVNKKLDDFKASMDRWLRYIFWGLIIGFTVLSFLLAALGWLVSAN